jgi:hypothetical protein
MIFWHFKIQETNENYSIMLHQSIIIGNVKKHETHVWLTIQNQITFFCGSAILFHIQLYNNLGFVLFHIISDKLT